MAVLLYASSPKPNIHFSPPHVPRAQLLFITLITFGQQYQPCRSSLHSFRELLYPNIPPAPSYVPKSPQYLVCPNIPPAPCYVPIFPQRPVMSQYSPTILLCSNIPPTPCYVPIFPSTLLCPNIPQHPVMSQYSPSTLLSSNIPPAPCYVPIIPSFPHIQQFSIYFSFPLLATRKC